MTSALYRPLLLAWHFLTVIRLNRTSHDATSKDLARSMAWYPLVGLCLGGILVVADRGLSLLFATGVVDVILIVILVGVTGGLHQDGLADTLDGVSGGKSVGDRLRIMRDPHIGAIGATGLVLDLALRFAGLQALPEEVRSHVLFCLPMFGRWGIVIASWGGRYARSEGGLAAPFLEKLSWREAGIATIFAVVVALWQLTWVAVLVCGLTTVLIARGVSWMAARLIGGMTGDVLGATNEAVEVVVLLILPVWS